MSYVKLISKIVVLMCLSMIGIIVGMFIGGTLIPFKVLDGRALSGLSNIKETILPTEDPNKDRI